MTTYFGRVYQVDISNFGTTFMSINGFPEANKNPLRVTFMIDQTPNAERSYGEITIYGLNRASRDAVYQEGDRVLLTAGYEASYSVTFDGEINNVEIGRDGADSYVKLFCMSGLEAWRGDYIDRSWGDNTPYSQILRDVAGRFGLPVEFVGDFSDFPRALKGKSFDRSAQSAMRSLEKGLGKMDKGYGFSWFIENGTVVIAREDAERANAAEFVYSAVTGLIGPPEITEKGVDITVLMNPVIRPFDTFRVEAINQQLTFNGIYYQGQDFAQTNGQGRNKVISVKHEGDSHGDTWETQLVGQVI